jgi:hypothetical protein
MPDIHSVSNPRIDRTRNRWVLRWKEDGKQRVKSTFRSEADAWAFHQTLTGEATPRSTDQVTVRNVAELIAEYDGTSTWWDSALGWLAGQLLDATAQRDSQRCDLIAKAARALGPLAASAAGQRDQKSLEGKLRALELRYREMQAATKHGTRVNTAEESGGAGGVTLRRDEAVH